MGLKEDLNLVVTQSLKRIEEENQKIRDIIAEEQRQKDLVQAKKDKAEADKLILEIPKRCQAEAEKGLRTLEVMNVLSYRCNYDETIPPRNTVELLVWEYCQQEGLSPSIDYHAEERDIDGYPRRTWNTLNVRW